MAKFSLNPMEGWNPVVDPAGVISGEGPAGGEYGESGQVIADPLDLFGWQARAEQEKVDKMTSEALGLQRDWMNYIKQQYAPYSAVARMALPQQAALAGLGGEEAKQRFVSNIEGDPLYQAKLRAGEQAVLRNAAATGGLRSGSSNAALAQMNQLLLGKEIQDRYQQLAGLSGQGFMGQQAESTFGGQALGGLTDIMGTQASNALAFGAAQRQNRAASLGGASKILGLFI